MAQESPSNMQAAQLPLGDKRLAHPARERYNRAAEMDMARSSKAGSYRARVFTLLALLVTASVVAACGGKPHGPEGTLEAYRVALASKDYAAAYDMMSSDFRDRHSREAFVRMMKENPREVADTAEQLARARESVVIQAELRYGLDERMRLVREGGGWRLLTNPIEFYSQDTARDALRSFVRAYRLERWDIMLRFVPNQYRERMTEDTLRRQFKGEQVEEMAERMKALEANIDAPISDKGDEARMPYGDRHEVMFVREDGLWKLQDLD
jgi:hypothetical protein